MGPVALFVVSHFRSPRRNRGVGDFQLGYNFHRSGAYFCQPELGQDDKTFICMMDYIGAKLVSCRLRSIGERMLLQTLENFGSQSFSPVVKALSVGLMTRWCLTTSAKMRRPTSSPRGRPRPTAQSLLSPLP